MKSLLGCLLSCVAVAFWSPTSFAGPVTLTTFPVGSLPEDIVLVPAGFGSLGGSYLVPDPTQNFSGTGSIWSVPSGGGAPSVFANLNTFQPVGGLFLPANYGSLAGQFLAAGQSAGIGGSDVVALDSAGNQTPIAQGIGPSIFGGVAIAPAGFDSVGGTIILANEGGPIYSMDTNLNFSVLPGVSALPFGAFGLAFAPSGFGAVGGDLLISDVFTNTIYALSPSGSLSVFTTVPFGPGQVGLRQMAFAAPGPDLYAGDLFVSVSGSGQGGGIAGSVDVLDPAGGVVAYLAQGSVGAPYDPRGILFPDATHVLIADSDPSIIDASITDFTPGSPIPEPATLFLVAAALAGLAVAEGCKRNAH